MTEERWSGVIFYPGYSVSDHGRVRRGDKILNGWVSTQGYRVYNMRNLLGRMKTVYAHRLVLLHFCGPPKFGGPTQHGLHWDDNKANNHIGNLRWGTAKDNAADSARNGRRKRVFVRLGADNNQTKLSEAEVREIRRHLAEGILYKNEIARMFGISPTGIQHIDKRRSWRHIA